MFQTNRQQSAVCRKKSSYAAVGLESETVGLDRPHAFSMRAADARESRSGPALPGHD